MTMLDRRTFIGGTAAAALMPAAAPAAAAALPPGEAAAAALLDRHAEALLAAYPEQAAYLGLDTGARAALKGKLTDHSPDAVRTRARDAAARLAELAAVRRDGLSPATATHVAVAEAAHRTAVDGWRRLGAGDPTSGDMAALSPASYRSTPYVVSAGHGAFVETPDLLENKHSVASRADAEAYLARLNAYADQLTAETGRIAADAGRGVALPAFLSDIATAQLRRALEPRTGPHPLAADLGKKARAAGLDGDWQGRAAAILDARVAPAIAGQAEALAAARGRGPAGPGMGGLPGAADRYAWLVAASTTTDRTPQAIHEAGLDQCRGLAAELDPLLRAQGLTRGTAGERLAELGRRPDQLFADTEAGRAELLAYLNKVVTELKPRLPRAFNKLAPGRLEIRRVPPAIQDGAPNGYAGAGSADGSLPGIYWINLRDTGIWPRFSLPTLTFHESIPGHIWQGEYLFSLPLIRQVLGFNAYSEGWGLYAEQLGDELGYYDGDPLGRIGYLQSMNFRAARLVADTGLHHLGWSMERAMAWFMATTGFTASQARSELNRYCVWPGQALGYKTGHNEINRLRDAARARLGARYDARGFNDLVVQAGGMPLSVLGQVAAAWNGAA